MRKWRTVLCAVMLFTLIGSVNVQAAEGIDKDQKGSISLTMKYKEEAVPNGTMTLYQVGEVEEENGNDSFVLTDTFAESNVVLPSENMDDTALASTAAKLAEYAKKNEISGTEVNVDQNGQMKAEELDLGLYLVVQTKTADGFYAISPFLVSVPMLVDGSYVYDVNATPKMEALKKTETTPDESNKPDGSDTSDGSNKPNGSDTSDGSNKPNGSDTSDGSNKPNGSDTPDGSNKPNGSDTPDGSNKPNGSDTPDGSNKPNGSDTSDGTDKPNSSDTSDGTDKPNGSGTPNASDKTTNTNTSDASTNPTLPQTGQLNWPVLVMAAFGLCLILVGCFLRSGKDDRYEA